MFSSNRIIPIHLCHISDVMDNKKKNDFMKKLQSADE